MYLKLCFLVILFAVVYARPSFLDYDDEEDDLRGPEEYNDDLIDTGFEDPAADPKRYRCPRGWAFRCRPNYHNDTITSWECKCYKRGYPGRGRDEPLAAMNGNFENEGTEGN